MIERDMQRPVRWTMPRGKRPRKKEKSGRRLSQEAKIRIVIIAIAAIVFLTWNLISNRAAYTGDVSGLISYAQGLGEWDRPIVEVTGYTNEYSVSASDTTKMLFLYSGSSNNPEVMVYFKNGVLSSQIGSRVTVRGELSSALTGPNSVTIMNAEMV